MASNTNSFLTKLQNLTPNWQANAVNATVTGLFSALSTLSTSLSANNIYKYYKNQEAEYLRSANEKARRLRLKGEIDLRSLRFKHTRAQGTNELAVAAAKGNISGSAMDILVQNFKVNTADERTQQIQTLWDVSDAKREALIAAISSANNAMTMAYQQRGNALSAITSFAANTIKPLLKDITTQKALTTVAQQQSIRDAALMKKLENYYGTGSAPIYTPPTTEAQVLQTIQGIDSGSVTNKGWDSLFVNTDIGDFTDSNSSLINLGDLG